MSTPSEPPSQLQQFKRNLEQTKDKSNDVKTQLDSIFDHCEHEFTRLEKFEHELNEKVALIKESELALAIREESINNSELTMKRDFEEEKQAALQDLTEREERIFQIEKKISSSTSLETKLGKNQVVKLNIGGKIFSTNMATLKSVKETFFTGYFNDYFQPSREEDDNAYFIDRPFEQFHLVLNFMRGIDIKDRIQTLNDHDLQDFVEEIVYYQLTPAYDILPQKGKNILKAKYGIESSKSIENVKFDPNYCSSFIKLESETRAKGTSEIWSSVLGTKSNSFKVKLICGPHLDIGFAPKRINVNDGEYYSKCGYYLNCSNGCLFSERGDHHKSYTNCQIENGSIVECLIENGYISYKIDDKSYGIAYSNITNADELYPAFGIGGHERMCIELVNE